MQGRACCQQPSLDGRGRFQTGIQPTYCDQRASDAKLDRTWKRTASIAGLISILFNASACQITLTPCTSPAMIRWVAQRNVSFNLLDDLLIIQRIKGLPEVVARSWGGSNGGRGPPGQTWPWTPAQRFVAQVVGGNSALCY
eukprot:366576-Chlamydomonas_euryale.AAC.6